jgi:hypothetical protein
VSRSKLTWRRVSHPVTTLRRRRWPHSQQAGGRHRKSTPVGTTSVRQDGTFCCLGTCACRGVSPDVHSWLDRPSSTQRFSLEARLPSAVLIGHADRAGPVAGLRRRDEIGEEDSMGDVTTASDGSEGRWAVETSEDLGATVSACGPFLVARRRLPSRPINV